MYVYSLVILKNISASMSGNFFNSSCLPLDHTYRKKVPTTDGQNM